LFVCEEKRFSKSSALKETARIFSSLVINFIIWNEGFHISGLNFDNFKPGLLRKMRAIATWNLAQHKGKPRKPVFKWSMAKSYIKYRIVYSTPETKAIASVYKSCKE
jgi:hypothetical protein